MKKIFTYFLAWLIITWLVSSPSFTHAQVSPLRANKNEVKTAQTEERREKLRSTLLQFNEKILSQLFDAKERIEKNSALSSQKQNEILLELSSRIDEIKDKKAKIEGTSNFIELFTLGKERRETGLKDRTLVREAAYFGLEARISKSFDQLEQSTEKMEKAIQILQKAGGETQSLEDMFQNLKENIVATESLFKESKNVFVSGNTPKAFELSKEVSGLLRENLADLKKIFSLLRENLELLKQKSKQ